MAFTKKTTFSNATQGTNDPVALDQGQIKKLGELGATLTPVSNDPGVLGPTKPTTVSVGGGTVPGYEDSNGSTFVLDTDGTVYDVSPTPTAPNNPVPPTVNTGPIRPLTPPVQPPPVLPPSNLGSGRIYTRFELGDIVPNQEEIVTRALWSQNVGNLTTFYTSSAQPAVSKQYFYSIYNSSSLSCGSEPQFAVAYGHKQGSGSADQGGQINDTPSRAVYGQFKQLCLEPTQERFVIGGTATDSIYVVSVNRARMREFLDEGNLEINLQALSGSGWLAGGGSQNAWTGSNVKPSPVRNIIRLVDDSRIASATVTTAGEVYNIVSGSLEDGVHNSSSPHYYGLLYRRLGVVVLDANVLDISSSFLTVTGSEVAGDNAYKLFTSISASALYTDVSGDYLGFQGRSGEKVKSSHYFVRVKNQEYNFSNNPTFVTGSEGDLSQPLMINNPQTFITEVGLYNDNKELIAVAKTNKPLRKNFTREATLEVKLQW